MNWEIITHHKISNSFGDFIAPMNPPIRKMTFSNGYITQLLNKDLSPCGGFIVNNNDGTFLGEFKKLSESIYVIIYS